MLTLTVLGCDGTHASAGGAASGYLLRSWDTGTAIWIDAGPGSFANLQRFIDPRSLNAIVLTHRHVDHCSDISQFETAARWVWGWHGEALPVFAPDGVSSRLNLGAKEGHDSEPVLEWNVVSDGAEVEVSGLRIRFSRTDHGPETLAVRVDGDGRSVGYSADTGPQWSMRTLGLDLDLALCEATFTKDYEGIPGHMSARQAGTTAKDARAKRLVVTHRWSTVSASSVLIEATAAFGARVDQAEVGNGYSI